MRQSYIVIIINPIELANFAGPLIYEGVEGY
jgi:hypothetical protein